MNARRFETWIETQMVPQLQPSDIVILAWPRRSPTSSPMCGNANCCSSRARDRARPTARCNTGKVGLNVAAEEPYVRAHLMDINLLSFMQCLSASSAGQPRRQAACHGQRDPGLRRSSESDQRLFRPVREGRRRARRACALSRRRRLAAGQYHRGDRGGRGNSRLARCKRPSPSLHILDVFVARPCNSGNQERNSSPMRTYSGRTAIGPHGRHSRHASWRGCGTAHHPSMRVMSC